MRTHRSTTRSLGSFGPRIVVLVSLASAVCGFFSIQGIRQVSAQEPQTLESPVVSGFERLARHGTDTLQGGMLLLNELGCVGCHASPVGLVFDGKRGPHFGDVGRRIEPEYVRRFLTDPHATKPGTTMPGLLHDMSPSEIDAVVEPLTSYLGSLRAADSLPPVTSGNVARGRELYHTIGCVACHAPSPTYEKPTELVDITGAVVQRPEIAMRSVPLVRLASKYQPGALARFLLDPLAVRPAGRMPRVPLSGEEAADIAAWLLADPRTGGSRSPERASPETLPATVEHGRGLFGKLGCRACHDTGNDDSIEISRHGKPLVDLDVGSARGCLAESPGRGLPKYHLDVRQREVLRETLRSLRVARDAEHHVVTLETRLAALNCHGCHGRDVISGPEAGRAYFFESKGQDLGEEGRLPPPLTGVGRKLQPDALRAILRGRGGIRPYLTVRMPDFGEHHASMLAARLEESDLSEKIRPTPRTARENHVGRNQWGRRLVGTTGLGCITCHDLNGHRSLGIRATDLISAPRRLRPEWFRDYLMNPALFRSDTRMPSLWPDGLVSFPGVAGGNVERQIDSIWVYLSETDQTRLPIGLEREGDFELKPEDETIVFRTFMHEVGVHAIAVGFPERVHAAFDARILRWALAWRGKFLDAEGTWDDRFAPLAKPLGTDVLTLRSGVAIAVLDDETAPWPIAEELSEACRFMGYRRDERGVPTFLYRCGELEVADRVVPHADGRSLTRTLVVKGDTGSVWYRAAAGKKVDRIDEGSFKIDEAYTIRISGVETRLRSSPNGPEVVAPLRGDGETRTIEEVWSW